MTDAAFDRPWHAHYDEGVPPSLEIEDVYVPEMLARAAQRWPRRKRHAVIFENCRLTYADLVEEVDKFAAGLASRGVSKDSRVAIQLPNLPQTTIAVLATLSLGAQCVMTNPLYTPPEVIHQWNDSACTVAVCGGWLYQKTVAGIRGAVGVKTVVVTGTPEYLRFPIKMLATRKLKKAGLHVDVPEGNGVVHWKTLMAGGHTRVRPTAITGSDLALLQYTGGTTGPAKGVMLSHANLSANIQQVGTWMSLLRPGEDTFLGSLPYFHVFGFLGALLLPIRYGATTVLMPDPRDIRRMMKNVVDHKISVFMAVPTLFNALNNVSGIEDIDVSCIRICVSGSAPLPDDVLKRFEQLTGAKIAEGYGMTEASPVTHTNPCQGQRKIGSIGLPLSNTDARIVDPVDGVTDVEPGKEGELIIRGPQVMQGYLNRPEATAETIRDGWLYTGDLAVMDEEGYFRIVGRKKDMILASGYNVYPDEIDRILCDHPDVVEACTIGIPHEKRGETVKSFVVLTKGSTCTADDLEQHCRANLAAYKIPRAFEFRKSLPKSAMMKLLRRELRDEEIAKRDASS